jgi:ATP-dependent helicase/nuclease subunit A
MNEKLVDVEQLTRQDEESRKQARSEFSYPLVLEAGAGTGKTAVLVARIVCWAMGPGWKRHLEQLQKAAGRSDGMLEHAEPDAEFIAARVLSRIAAITFTERAAAEMAERVAAAFAALRDDTPVIGLPSDELGLGKDQQSMRAAALLSCIDRLQVSTIHSFCRRLLADHPLAAGIHPRFSVDADGEGLARLVDDVMVEALDALYGEGAPSDIVALASLGVGPDRIAEALIALASQHVDHRALQQDFLGAERVVALARELAEQCRAVRDCIGDALVGVRSARLARALEAVALLDELLAGLPSVSDVESLLSLCDEQLFATLLDRLDNWRRAKLTQSENEHFGALAERLASVSERLFRLLRHVVRLQPRLLALAPPVLCKLLAAVYQRARQSGLISFDGLLHRAVALVTQDRAVAEQISASLDQLMVDEFQDTDSLQCQLIGTLALQSHAPQPGLMIVGDPKQSIYGWRGADLRAYEAFVAQVLQSGGQRYRLSVSFRSDPPILDEVTRIVSTVMLEQRGVQPAYQKLVPCAARSLDQGFREGEHRAVEHWIAWEVAAAAESENENVPAASERAPSPSNELPVEVGPDTRAARARSLEARALAADLESLAEIGVPWRDVAILLRTTTHQEVYIEALKQAGIPFLVERDRSYYRRREVIEASAILRALFDPADQVALVAALRSSVVGVPDAALLPLWRAGFPGAWTRIGKLPDGKLSDVGLIVQAALERVPARALGVEHVTGWHENLIYLVHVAQKVRKSAETMPMDQQVEQLRDLLALEETAAARYLGAFRLANLERFFRDLLEGLTNEQSAASGPYALLRQLRLGVLERRDQEEAPIGDETLDAVRVMTIHKAKGLTFEHVYLVGTHGEPRGGQTPQAARLERHDETWEGQLFGAATLGFEALRRRRELVQQAEGIRTLYVALTRPRARLVVSGRWPSLAGSTAAKRSHINLVTRRDGMAAVQRAFAAEAERVEVSDETHRFVHLGRALKAAAASTKADAEPSEPTGPKKATDDGDDEEQRLELLRRQAAARQGRPRVIAATALRSEQETAAESELAQPPRRIYEPVVEPAALDESSLDGQLGLFDRACDPKEVGRLVGIAAHRALELLDLSLPVCEALALQVEQVERWIDADLRSTTQAEPLKKQATEQARQLLTDVSRSAIARALETIRPHIIARELPLLLKADALADVEQIPEHSQPTDALVGSLDMLYRDSKDESIVIVDYKTDRVSSRAAIRKAKDHYAAQAGVYRRAVQLSLGLPMVPRYELWFLRAGKIERI